MPGQCSGNWLSFVCHWSSSCRCVVFISKLKNERKKMFYNFLGTGKCSGDWDCNADLCCSNAKTCSLQSGIVQRLYSILKTASFDNWKISNVIFEATKELGWGAQWENDIHGGKGMHVTNICFFTVKRQLLCNFRRYFNLELVTIELRPIHMNNHLYCITYFCMNFKPQKPWACR